MEKEEKSKLKILFQALIVGVIAGAIVGLFRFGIELTSQFWLGLFQKAHQNLWWFVAIILGLFLVGLISGFFVKQYPHVGGSGIPEVKLQMQGKLHLPWWSILWRKLIGGILVIGTGLFLGPEGPSLQLGSSIGQGVAGAFKQNKSNTRILLAAGAASGLSAAFGAPLSGALFVLEEVFHNFSPSVWMNALIGAIASDFVVSNIFGQKPSLALPYNHMFPTYLYWHLLILGIILGLLGHLYKKGLFGLKKIYAKIHILPSWLYGLIPLAILIPIMYYLPLITGPGNHLILSLPKMITASSWSLVGMLGAYYIIRIAFSIVSYDSGLPSGIFLPILTMGALIGGCYGLLMVQLGLLPEKLVINLIIFSMAGYFAAIIRAPFTAIVLITEMVGSLLHLMPLAVVAFVALLVDQLLGGRPIYGQLAAAMEKPQADHQLSGEADQLVLPVYENSQLVDKTIREISWPKNTLVKTIQRDNEMIIPDGKTKILPGDILVLEVDASQRGNVYTAMKKLQGVELDG
ncbi:ClC family H(+)/Cl(-) exchange transporter [Lactobacillus sp. PV037]|uniref:ClC family H(+)/Cl(-) exchange transporter n=1 Tax=Lactobacillus sp. PV037 TaxID=2594496 RepID=UPI002240BDB3|nr:ClC family H(+)/Cl(-) exchange transporter [Lactobacillus sp. PV037]QNQ84364.1 ClC family H(+)/Cl(-) exchange transporter [Lactobacillus sp. PV037]